MYKLLVGTYTKGCPGHHAKEPKGKGIGIVTLNDKLELIDDDWNNQGGENPSALTQKGNNIYAACEQLPIFSEDDVLENIKFNTGRIDHFQIENGKLVLISKLENIGDFPCKIVNFELASKHFIACANYGYVANGGGEVTVHKLNNLYKKYDLQKSNFYQNIDDHEKLLGVHPERQECAHVHDVIVEEDSLFFTDLGCDSVCWYVWDDIKFVLKKQYRLQPGTGPRHVRKHNNKLYVVCELINVINVIDLETDEIQQGVTKHLLRIS